MYDPYGNQLMVHGSRPFAPALVLCGLSLLLIHPPQLFPKAFTVVRLKLPGRTSAESDIVG